MSDVPPQVYQQLRHDEGVRLKPYRDTPGNWTIGVGHKLSNGITESQAQLVLVDDVLIAQKAVATSCPSASPVDGPRYWVLVEMAFNMGSISDFKRMLAAYVRHDFESAASEMLSSKWASQVGARATRLAAQMETNEWQLTPT